MSDTVSLKVGRAPTPIAVIGITDLGPVSLSEEARGLVAAAELLCGGERHLAFFPEHPAERLVLKSNVRGVFGRLDSETRRVVVLASGDPDCFGIGPVLVDSLGIDRVRIVPNLSAVQLACARLGVAWQDAAILSAHGRPLETILPAALLAETALIHTDGHNTPSRIAAALLDAGDEAARVDVFERLGGPDERHVSGGLQDIAGQEFDPLNLMIVRHAGPPRPWPLGLPEDAFAHRGGQITKAEVRAVSLAQLRLHERCIMWDVGSGCGSVAIEAAALLRHGQVFAVERDAAQLVYLSDNRRRFGAGNVTVVAGEAPSCLDDLPNPNRVFVGGSGGYLLAIVSAAFARGASRTVVNLVSLEHVGAVLSLAGERGWHTSVTQVSIARSRETAGLLRLAALNPTFIVTLVPGESEV